MEVLGIDIGGSGIKGAPVNIQTGELLGERYRVSTPSPSTPKAVAKTVAEVVRHFDWNGAIGCGFPAVIRNGEARTAANIDPSWLGTNVAELLSQQSGCPVTVLNDADAAGLAEMKFGAGRDRGGVVLLITIGTGLGSAVFTEGILVPNSELGHIRVKGKIGERYASDAVRKKKSLKWKKWAKRFDKYLDRVEFLFSPDLIILGGGASKKLDKFEKYLSVEAEIKAAELLNEAGIVGAALSVINSVKNP